MLIQTLYFEPMEVIVEVKYNWNLSDYPDLDKETKELLKEHAEERMFQLRKEGYQSGELHYHNNEIRVWGWWYWTILKKE